VLVTVTISVNVVHVLFLYTAEITFTEISIARSDHSVDMP